MLINWPILAAVAYNCLKACFCHLLTHFYIKQKEYKCCLSVSMLSYTQPNKHTIYAHFIFKTQYPLLKTVKIQISWPLMKPADQDPHCFHPYNFWFGLLLYVPVNNYGPVGTVSSPNHTFFLGKLERAVIQYFVHILSLVTDNNPS